MKGWFNMQKLIHGIYHINKIQGEKAMIISNVSGIAFEKIQYLCIKNKNTEQLQIEGTYHNIIKDLY